MPCLLLLAFSWHMLFCVLMTLESGLRTQSSLLLCREYLATSGIYLVTLWSPAFSLLSPPQVKQPLHLLPSILSNYFFHYSDLQFLISVLISSVPLARKTVYCESRIRVGAQQTWYQSGIFYFMATKAPGWAPRNLLVPVSYCKITYSFCLHKVILKNKRNWCELLRTPRTVL